jgi:heat shock protein HslJ
MKQGDVMQRKIVFTLTLITLLLLTACQPISPLPTSAAGDGAQAGPALPASIVLPDGLICAWAGEGATLAFDRKRLNYTCTQGDKEIIGLLNNPTAVEPARWAVEKATISHGDGGFALQTSETVTFLAVTLELADGTRCAFAGEGATLAFDGQRLNYTCNKTDQELTGILGDLVAGKAGVFLATKALIERSGSESVLKATTQASVTQINGAPAGATEGAMAMEANPLVGVVWQWQNTIMSNDATFTPVDPARYTLTFLLDGKVQAQLDCNTGHGAYTLTGNQLTLGPLASTRKACPTDSLDSVFGQQLSQVGSYLMDGGNLVLLLQVDSGSMVFAPTDPAPAKSSSP